MRGKDGIESGLDVHDFVQHWKADTSIDLGFQLHYVSQRYPDIQLGTYNVECHADIVSKVYELPDLLRDSNYSPPQSVHDLGPLRDLPQGLQIQPTNRTFQANEIMLSAGLNPMNPLFVIYLYTQVRIILFFVMLCDLARNHHVAELLLLAVVNACVQTYPITPRG